MRGMKNPQSRPTDRNVFTRLTRRWIAPSAAAAAIDVPDDDNFYFETTVASPAVQLSVWELINDAEEPRDALPDEDERDDDVLVPGQTAPVEFWAGERGQALVRAFDGGPAASLLGSWLADTFPNLYGPTGLDLDDKSNAYVTGVVRRLARAEAPRLEAQVLALALAAYATRAVLGGPAAASFGFRVSPLGVAPCVCNIGPLGAPFRVANGSSLTVLQLLRSLDAQARAGQPLAGHDALREQAHHVLEMINRFGGAPR
jgi:hypothetical protein